MDSLQHNVRSHDELTTVTNLRGSNIKSVI